MRQNVNIGQEKNLQVKPKLKKSRYTVAILASFLVGIFCGVSINIAPIISFILILTIIVMIFKMHLNKTQRLFLYIFLGLILGLTYYRLWDWHEKLATLPFGNTRIKTSIVEQPKIDNGKQQLIVNYQKTKIMVETETYPKFSYGDIVLIEGKLENVLNIRPFNNFDYGNYLFKKGIHGQIKSPQKIVKVESGGNIIFKKIYQLGGKFNDAIVKVLPEPYASFQIGLLFGNKTNISDSLMSAFNRTGTTHIVAVSGYNVTIIISALALILARYSRKLTFYGTLFGILFFIILTGAGASVLRAGLLAALAAFARLSGRKPYVPILILVSATILILFNPYALKNDISFQLSFLAFVGLISISPVIEKNKFIATWPGIFKIAFCETMGAQILVLPILLYNFGTLSIIAPLANILVLSVIPVSMFLGFLTGFASLIWTNLASIIAILAYLVLKYIIIVVEKLSAIPWSAITLKTTEWWWIPCYYILIFLLIRYQNEKNLTAKTYLTNISKK